MVGGTPRPEWLERPLQPRHVGRPVDTGEAEYGRVQLGAGQAGAVHGAIDRVADAVRCAAQPHRLPVAGAGGARADQRAVLVADRSVRLGSAAVDTQDGRHRMPADRYARSTASITTAPSSPLGRGCLPSETASMNSATWALYIGCAQCS